MKKYLKYIGIVISLVALLGIIFFAMDFCRVNNKKNPIFCIKTKVYEDGGTREFLGLGYKVIDFHTINGFYETKIGSYFMKYEDFDDEISKYDNIVIDEIVKSEEYIKQIENAIIKLDLPKEWHYEEIDNPENQNAKFELKLYKDSKEGKEHIIDLSLDKLSEQLNPDIFFRTNRQTLVSVHAIQKIENYFFSKIIVQVKPPFKDKITVSREKIAAMKLWLNY